jgi:hypothetical protein
VHKQNRTTTINSKSQAEEAITTNYGNKMKNLPSKATLKQKNIQNPTKGMSSKQRRSHHRAAMPPGAIVAQYGPTPLS